MRDVWKSLSNIQITVEDIWNENLMLLILMTLLQTRSIRNKNQLPKKWTRLNKGRDLDSFKAE